METRANYIIVGLFTLAGIIGAFAFVYWFHHGTGAGGRSLYKVSFQGPVAGLRSGAAVSFNGIRVGEVVELAFDPDDPRGAIVTVSLKQGTPVRADTEVSLDYQGLTGIASLALRGGKSDAALLVAKDGVPLLNAGPSASQDLMQTALATIRRIDSFIADNEKPFRNSMRNIESFTDVLSRNSDKFNRIMTGLDGLVTDGRRTIGVIERTVKNFDENPTRLLFGGRRSSGDQNTSSSNRR